MRLLLRGVPAVPQPALQVHYEVWQPTWAASTYHYTAFRDLSCTVSAGRAEAIFGHARQQSWLPPTAGPNSSAGTFVSTWECYSTVLNTSNEPYMVSVDGAVCEASRCLSLFVNAGQSGLGEQGSMTSAAWWLRYPKRDIDAREQRWIGSNLAVLGFLFPFLFLLLGALRHESFGTKTRKGNDAAPKVSWITACEHLRTHC